ncbi:LTA synthase family protein [Bacillus sp. P14.5]|uniref:LTA synthase family protein n=1 Tax=Bacillus sp. P14.5 TaxID=1983400 RepID=UPI000DE8F336|nr:LTA synthase family protein [Bacillus sp. P14.5]
MIERKRVYLMQTLLIFIFSISWLIKQTLFINELSFNINILFMTISSLAVGFVVCSFSLSKPTLKKAALSFFLYFLVTLLLYADVVYERYYDAILDIQLLSQANQVGTVFSSILSLIYISDLWYWVDLPFLLILLIYYSKRNKTISAGLAPLFLYVIGLGMIILLAFTTLEPSYSDQYKVAVSGIIPAHIYNTFKSNDPIEEAVFLDTSSTADEDESDSLQKRFSLIQDIQKSNPDFGKFKGKNLIIIQAESLNDFVINLEVEGKEVTPVLNELASTSNYYPNIYLQIGRGNTSDAEFVANNSLYPMSDNGVYKKYPNNNYLSLANVLREKGYETSVTHGNSPEFWNRQKAYPNQGFDTFYHSGHKQIESDEIVGLGISDESIFRQMVKQYKNMDQPFYNFIVSLTVHRPFELPQEHQHLNLTSNIKNTPTGNYLESVNYFDQALGSFITDLKENNLWDNTIFIIYGDHYGPVPKDREEMKDLINVDFDEKERFNIPLIIHHPEQSKGVVNKVIGSQMDIYPTISQMMGITRPLVQFGLPLDSEIERTVGFYYETTQYSYYGSTYSYQAAHTGKFEDGKCINSQNGTAVKLENCKLNYEKVYNDVQLSRYLLENNLIDKIFPIKQ